MREFGAAGSLVLAVGAIALLAFMDTLVKSLSAGLPTIEILFFRQFVAAILLGALVFATKAALPRPKMLKVHIIRSVMIGITAFSFFYALGELPLSLVTAISLTAPVMVAGLGVIILKEEPSKTLFFASMVGFAGALIVTFGGDQTPFSGTGNIWAWIAAIISPFTYAASIIILKTQTHQSSVQAITFVQAVLIAVFCLPLLSTSFVVPNAEQLSKLITIGMLGAVGFLLFVKALKQLPASVFAMVDNTALLWAALYGYMFFTEVPHVTLWIGAVLIIGACLTIAQKQVRKSPRS